MNVLDPAALAIAASIALVSLLEVLPPLGRFIPGHLVVGVLGAVAFAMGAGPGVVALAIGAGFAGALAGDLLNFDRARRHPRLVVASAWWLPGGDVDRIERGLARNAFATFVARRFFTRDRALLALVAGGWGMAPARFAIGAFAACLVWAAAWVGAGYAIGLATRALPVAASVGIAAAALLVLSRPLDQRRATPA